MTIVAIESQCLETVTIHLIEERDFILSDQKTRWKSFQ